MLLMLGLADSIPWLLGIVVLVAVILAARHYLSADAREVRRRARSHGAVVSKKHGPSVRLTAKVDKPKRRRKR